jgi:predicted DNA-binding transcriptional regulator AlpA
VTELLDNVQMFGEDVAVPKNPEREGSPRLITIGQIAEEHGVSRSSVHTYRRRPTFPQPVQVEGSTRIQYRADEVAAWFEANPPQQGKRTDLTSQDEGAAMPQTTEPSVSETVSRPEYLTEEQWAALLFGIASGVADGIRNAGLSRGWLEHLSLAAMTAVRGRMEELVAQEEASDG